MADDEIKKDQPFLSRWSERKQAAREAPPEAQPLAEAETPVPELPPVDQLTLESDFSGFMHPKVDVDLRRAALRKLFSDPHFNVMDGLDIYIDDYSKPDPLPPGMLAGLRQAQNILAWAKETKEEAAARSAAASPQSAVLPVGQSESTEAVLQVTQASTPSAEVMPPAADPIKENSAATARPDDVIRKP